MEDAPKFLNFPKSECPDILVRLPRHKWPTSWSNIEDPVVLSDEICTDTQLQASRGKDSSTKLCSDFDGKKCRIGKVYFVDRKQGLFFSVNVDDIEDGWKEAECGFHVEEIEETCWS